MGDSIITQNQIDQLISKAKNEAGFSDAFLQNVITTPDNHIDSCNGIIKKLAYMQLKFSAQKQAEMPQFSLNLKEKFYLTDISAVVQMGFITKGESKCRVISTDNGLYMNLNELNDLLGYATLSFGKTVRGSAMTLKEVLCSLEPLNSREKPLDELTPLTSFQLTGNKELPLKYVSVAEARAAVNDSIKPIARQFGEWLVKITQKTPQGSTAPSRPNTPPSPRVDEPVYPVAMLVEPNPIIKKKLPTRISYDSETRISDPQMLKVANDFMKRIHNFDNNRIFYIIYLFSVKSGAEQHHIFKYGYSDVGIFDRLSEHQKKLHSGALPIFAVANDTPKEIETTFGKTMTARGWEHQLASPGGTECIKVPVESWEIIITIVNDLVGYSRAGEQLAIAQEKTKQMQILQEMINKLPEANRLEAMKMFMGSQITAGAN